MQLRDYLDQLSQFESISNFSQLYYELVAARLEDDASVEPALIEHFRAHLRHELRFHDQLRNLGDADSVEIGKVVSIAERRRAALEETIGRVRSVSTCLATSEATAELILAECSYHLKEYDSVVAHLDRAGELGVREPLVYFALGYNRFLAAQQAHTVLDEVTEETEVIDPAGYRGALLKAVSDFEAGLNGGPMDPHLYWWIATCLERAGFPSAASHAFSQAGGIDPADGPAAFGLGPEPDGTAEPETLPPITLEEVSRAGELLKRTFSVADLLKEP